MIAVVILNTDACPCQSGECYQNCCGPLHHGQLAPTANALMRSRYAAFVLELYHYLIDTHHTDYRADITIASLSASKPDQWLGLDIEEFIEHLDTASVTFKAWYKHQGNLSAIYEKSSFVKVDERWLYTSGEQYAVRLPKTNALCVCKSGKKFKRCCK